MPISNRPSDREHELRRFSIENAVAQQRLEGLTVSAETLEDMRKVAEGEITTDQAVKRATERILAGSPNVALLG